MAIIRITDYKPTPPVIKVTNGLTTTIIRKSETSKIFTSLSNSTQNC